MEQNWFEDDELSQDKVDKLLAWGLKYDFEELTGKDDNGSPLYSPTPKAIAFSDGKYKLTKEEYKAWLEIYPKTFQIDFDQTDDWISWALKYGFEELSGTDQCGNSIYSPTSKETTWRNGKYQLTKEEHKAWLAIHQKQLKADLDEALDDQIIMSKINHSINKESE
jgi:hypothetical protein